MDKRKENECVFLLGEVKVEISNTRIVLLRPGYKIHPRGQNCL